MLCFVTQLLQALSTCSALPYQTPRNQFAIGKLKLAPCHALQVTVAGQVLPVLANVTMQLTTTRLSFQPASVDFGLCNLGEKTGVTVQLTNHSKLPQKYGRLAA